MTSTVDARTDTFFIAFDNSPYRNGMYRMIGTTGGGCFELERLPVRRALRSASAAAPVVLFLACASPPLAGDQTVRVSREDGTERLKRRDLKTRVTA
jgi:hypothetical protein